MTVVAIDRSKGTITVDSVNFLTANVVLCDTFNQILKEYYGPDGISGLTRTERPSFAGCKLTPPPITPAVVVALAMLGSIEWLRQRKEEVARAEATGDYGSLLADFVAWLRGILSAWRGAT